MSAVRDNGRKVREILTARGGSADLYRTVVAGPSGQRGAVCVGRVAYTWDGPYEMQVFTPREHNEAGYAARNSWTHPGMWTVWEGDLYEGVALRGWASSLSLAADVLVNGEHAALRNHDSARTSAGSWIAYVPQDES